MGSSHQVAVPRRYKRKRLVYKIQTLPLLVHSSILSIFFVSLSDILLHTQPHSPGTQTRIPCGTDPGWDIYVSFAYIFPDIPENGYIYFLNFHYNKNSDPSFFLLWNRRESNPQGWPLFPGGGNGSAARPVLFRIRGVIFKLDNLSI